jgi:co-chaperonin GroES (HSP10)
MTIKNLVKDKVLVQISEVETQTASGLFLPGGSSLKSKLEGTILMVGPNVKGLNIGDSVRYYEHCGTEVEHDGKNCIILREEGEICLKL